MTIPTTVVPSSSFTRPADTTAYAVGDLVANSTTAGSVVPLSWGITRVDAGSAWVRRARLQKSSTSVTNAQFRLHLYNTSPTPDNGDNGSWSTNQSANYLGYMDFILTEVFNDGTAGNAVPEVGTEINFVLDSGRSIYGLLEARAAYTPASGEIFQVKLECLQN